MKNTLPTATPTDANNTESRSNRLRDYEIDPVAVRAACENALETWRPAMGEFFLARFLGLALRYDDQHCTIDFDVADFMLNPKGTLHGGIIALTLDTSMGHLLSHLYGTASTLEMKVQYLRAVAPGPAKVVASVLKKGHSVCFLQADFYDSSGEMAAFATSTWKLSARHNPQPLPATAS
ncbi:PaaI family thioesterase [Paralcaligenes ureilyticus]|uniref:Uncharacterized protein (TIGR00369 family) n=1 Tax=Paralcaligenes ureilyticus TaxID=627131 RepID=A0A4V2UXJ0_9BURK|nr:PaaI family thioesterase [Paralcaligenes ureilyticus]TCT03708.1 uncharacterized protein (TIGR00369 family) [Paralcaligenes ureilyticus]